MNTTTDFTTDLSDEEMLKRNPFWLLMQRYDLADVYQQCYDQAFRNLADEPIYRAGCMLKIYFASELYRDIERDYSEEIPYRLHVYRQAERLTAFLKSRLRKNLYLCNALTAMQEARRSFLSQNGFHVPVFVDFSDDAKSSML